MTAEANIGRDDLAIGIVGAGAMGRGIAQVAAEAGIAVRLYDVSLEAVGSALKTIATMVDRAAAKGRITAQDAAHIRSRVTVTDTLSDLAPCHVVIEAIVEDLDAKQTLMRALEAIVADDCLIASNTSSLSITAIAAACRLPGRVAGMHFFNPVPLMRVVEVVGGLRTAPETTEALVRLAGRFGHRPVRVADSPGFLVNHAGRGLITEGLRIVQEGVATPHDVDRVMREAAGFRMGPFELFDLTGLDVSAPILDLIYAQFYQEPRFRPTPLPRLRVAAGLYGRKSGEGFYRYPDGRQEQPPEPVPPTLPDQPPVWVSAADAARRAPVIDLLAGVGAEIDDGAEPHRDSLCLVTPLGADATTTAIEQGLDAERTLAVDTLFDLAGRRTLMATIVTADRYRAAAHALFASAGGKVTVIRDSTGFIAQRVVATIVNIACDIAQQRIAAPDDIDAAVTLGLGYPEGPLALGDRLGGLVIHAILRTLHDMTGDPRYRPSPWLSRRAALGASLRTPEA